MAKYEIIVRETRVLKYKIEAPTQAIGIDRIISDSYLNPSPYQTQRLSREIYAVDLPEPAPAPTPTTATLEPQDRPNIHPLAPGLTPHPTEPVVEVEIPKIHKRGKKNKKK